MQAWRLAVLGAALAGALAAVSIAGGATSCFGVKKTVNLSGTVEVPSGDPDGSGRAIIGLDVKEGMVCWSITTRGVEPLSVAHVHRGRAGEAGPPVVTWTMTGRAGKGCIAASRSLIRQILRSPRQYYVNVHNRDYPGGALRGQLR